MPFWGQVHNKSIKTPIDTKPQKKTPEMQTQTDYSTRNSLVKINKMKMCSPSGHPRYRWVCFFIRFEEMQHCITCSPMHHPLQWMGAVRLRVQTADKNITIIHTTPTITVLWSQKVCVCKKHINHEYVCNFKSIIHKACSSWKSCLFLIRREICTVYNPEQSKRGFWS